MTSRHRRRGRRRLALSRNLIIRLLLVLIFVVAAGALSISVSGANIFRSVRPDLAMTFQPGNARARIRAAEQLIGTRSIERSRLADVDRLAREALRRDPTLAPAWRLLGIVALARNQQDQAAARFRFAGRVSKRDMPTQLWLIEERVQANDIPGALTHYDAALRTSTGSYDVLFPILVSATADNNIVGPIATLVNTMPPWRQSFLERLAAGAPNPDNAARLFALVIRQAPPAEREVVAAAMRRMTERRQFRPALQLYQLLTGADPRQPPALLRNGAFDQPNRFAPLEWDLEDQEELRAELGGSRLRLQAASGAGGSAARQLLMLPPGAYQISAQTGPAEESRPARLGLSVRCGNEQQTMLLEQQLPPATGRTPFAARFSVPAGCDGQWLSLNVQSDFDPGGVAGWIDSLTIQRL